jgi:hypothetical protein
MRTRLRIVLMSLLIATAAAVAAAPPVASAVLASCPAGTHWDSTTQTCR